MYDAGEPAGQYGAPKWFPPRLEVLSGISISIYQKKGKILTCPLDLKSHRLNLLNSIAGARAEQLAEAKTGPGYKYSV
jgi:hypothetical protein